MRIGIDLGGTKTELAVLDDRHQVLWRQRLPSAQLDTSIQLDQKQADSKSLDKAYQQTISIIEQLLLAAVAEHPRLKNLPIGIGTPGSENSQGRLRNCNSVWLNGKNFKEDLELRLQRSVRLANDANCFALAEAQMGAGQAAKSVFGVILGTGVGGGFVFNGALHAGANGVAGEWGHNLLSVKAGGDRACYCGRSNCIETWLSGPGLSESFWRASGERASAVEVVALSEKNHPIAREVWQAYCQQLAEALAQVINVMDPEVIVVGGGLSNAADLYRQIPLYWAPHIFSEEISTRLLQASLGDSAGVFGAAWLW